MTMANFTFSKVLIMMAKNHDTISDGLKYIIIITSFIVCIISYTLYAIVCYLVLTRKKLQTRANFVTSMLFVSGAILGVIVIPMVIAELLSPKLQKTESYRAAELYLLMTYVIANTKSINMISLNTAIRLRTQKLVKKRYILLSMIFSTIISAVLPGVLAYIGLTYGLKPLGLTVACGIGLSFVILCASYGFVIHEVKKSKKRLSFTGGQSHNSTYDKKVKRTIDRILLSFVFTNICLFASGLVLTYQSFDEEFGIKYRVELMHFQTAAYFALILSIVINPLIYFYTQSDLRKEVKTLVIYQSVFSVRTESIEINERK